MTMTTAKSTNFWLEISRNTLRMHVVSLIGSAKRTVIEWCTNFGGPRRYVFHVSLRLLMHLLSRRSMSTSWSQKRGCRQPFSMLSGLSWGLWREGRPRGKGLERQTFLSFFFKRKFLNWCLSPQETETLKTTSLMAKTATPTPHLPWFLLISCITLPTISIYFSCAFCLSPWFLCLLFLLLLILRLIHALKHKILMNELWRGRRIVILEEKPGLMIITWLRQAILLKRWTINTWWWRRQVKYKRKA